MLQKHERVKYDGIAGKSHLRTRMTIIRTSQPSDLPALRELSIAAFVNAYAEYNTEADMRNYVSMHFSEDALRAEMSDSSLYFLLAFEGDELVGYAKLNLVCDPQGTAKNPVEIARFYTKPECIGRGIGKEMLVAVETFAREKGYDAIWLGVWQRNFKAINFYQREGFRIIGLTQFLLGEDLQDDFVVMKALW